MFLETIFFVVVFVVLVAGPFVLGRRLNNTSGEGSPAPKLLAARTPLFDMVLCLNGGRGCGPFDDRPILISEKMIPPCQHNICQQLFQLATLEKNL